VGFVPLGGVVDRYLDYRKRGRTPSADMSFPASHGPMVGGNFVSVPRVTGAVSVPPTLRLPTSQGPVLRPPTRIYSARELMRRAAEPGPYHNFPESFNQLIFDQGSRTLEPNFWRTAKTGLSDDSIMYSLRGSVNGVDGTFEIGVRPSLSGNTEVIMHRFFKPD
jgi:hypothetical protein